jgi:anti-sigma factor RsiW
LRDKAVPLAISKEVEQRMDRAHRRYLAALKQLTTLRRLLPTVAPTPTPRPGKPLCAKRTTRKRQPATKRRRSSAVPLVVAGRLRAVAPTVN